MIKSKTKFVVVLILLGSCASYQAKADTLVDVDFNLSSSIPSTVTQADAAVLGSTGDVWNPVTAAGSNGVTLSSTNLFTSAGSSTSSGILLSGTGFSTFKASSGAMDAATLPLMQDYIYGASGSPLTLTLNGLTAYDGDTFTLVVYAAGNSGFGTDLSLTGGTNLNSATLSTTGANREISSGIGVAYNTFMGTITGDTLTLNTTAPSGTQFTEINGFQLDLASTPAPEPTTWAMLLGGLALFSFIFRHRFAKS